MGKVCVIPGDWDTVLTEEWNGLPFDCVEPCPLVGFGSLLCPLEKDEACDDEVVVKCGEVVDRPCPPLESVAVE